MTTSTDGQICYGILFEEDFEFPWDKDEDNENDIETWWIDTVLGYKPPFELFDDRGNYLGGVVPPQDRLDAYYAHRRKFVKKSPKLPAALVNHQSAEYPAYILAVPESIQTAKRGYPTEFDPTRLMVTPYQWTTLLEFCNKFGIEHGEPHWYLSSFWG